MACIVMALYNYGLYSYGPNSFGIYSYGIYSYGLCSYGLHSYGLYGYGLCSAIDQALTTTDLAVLRVLPRLEYVDTSALCMEILEAHPRAQGVAETKAGQLQLCHFPIEHSTAWNVDSAQIFLSMRSNVPRNVPQNVPSDVPSKVLSDILQNIELECPHFHCMIHRTFHRMFHRIAPIERLHRNADRMSTEQAAPSRQGSAASSWDMVDHSEVSMHGTYARMHA